MGKDYIRLIIDYTHNIKSCKEHMGKYFIGIFPKILQEEEGGFYKKKEKQIEKMLYGETKQNIIKILHITPLNIYQLKKILKMSYSNTHDHVNDLKKLKLIIAAKKKSKLGKNENSLSIHPNVKILHLSKKEKQLFNYIKLQMEVSEANFKDFKRWIEHKRKQ